MSRCTGSPPETTDVDVEQHIGQQLGDEAEQRAGDPCGLQHERDTACLSTMIGTLRIMLKYWPVASVPQETRMG